jgi:diguanylate cyclase (GGDEF)-like protein
MSPTPLQVLVLSQRPLDLVTSAHGPFIAHQAASLAEVDDMLNQHAWHALVVEFGPGRSAEQVLHWNGLARALLETALVLVSPEPTLAECQRWLQAGVREVASSREIHGDAAGRLLRMAIERKRQDDAARRAYSIDLATGLPNHQQLLEHMTHLLALREREPAPMAVVVLQLEGLQAVEAAQGVEAANVLRRKAAVRLRSALRASDVVASLGRDMFAVLLAWMDADEDAEPVARKLLATASVPMQVSGQAVPLGMRYGLAQSPAHGRDAQSLLKRATAQAAGGDGRLVRLGEAANDGG